MPLILAPIGQPTQVIHVSGDDKLRKHLESLGIVKEKEITVLSQEKNGIIIKVNDSRLALDKNVASLIQVVVE